MLMELLIRLRERGCTIVVSSHTARVLEAADKTIDVTELAAPGGDGTALSAVEPRCAETH
jgi:excinuclease UvrABC ATPase subunit